MHTRNARGSVLLMVNHLCELCKKLKVYNYFSSFSSPHYPNPDYIYSNIKVYIENFKNTFGRLKTVGVWKSMIFIRYITNKKGLKPSKHVLLNFKN